MTLDGANVNFDVLYYMHYRMVCLWQWLAFECFWWFSLRISDALSAILIVSLIYLF